jgi:hypothetical protein
MGWLNANGIWIGRNRGGGISWQTFWNTLISATVEDAAPNDFVLTFASGKPSLGVDDFTIAGFPLTGAIWAGAVLTLTSSTAVIYNDTPIITFVPTGGTTTVTNNMAALLNTYTNATAAYSVRLLKSDYAGACLRVKRSSDNTEEDIGFVNRVLDTVSLLAFVGAGNGFVAKWYDQSGSGNDMVLAANQPLIVDTGSLIVQDDGRPGVLTNAVDTNMTVNIPALANAAALSFFFAYSTPVAAAADAENGFIWTIGTSGINGNMLGVTGGTGYLTGEYMDWYLRRAEGANQRVGSTTYRRAANTLVIENHFVLSTGISSKQNGNTIAQDLTNGGGNVNANYTPAAANVDSDIYFGMMDGVSSRTAVKYSEIILYITDKSASRVAIENNQGLFFLNNVLNEQNLELASNPYNEINFATVNQYKANFHTHSTESDAQASNTVPGVAEAYSNYGYKILAITDHDTYPSNDPDPTWALGDFSEHEPSATNALAEYYPDLDLLMVMGNELTSSPTTIHHRNALLCEIWTAQQIIDDFATKKNDIDWTLAKIGEMGGLSFLCHPSYHSGYDLAFYTDIFDAVATCLGIEVYNQALIRTESKIDEVIWDQILTDQMPARQVLGFSNTDDHSIALDTGVCYNVMLMSGLTEAALRTALTSGQFYFVYDPLGTDIERHNPVVTPIITNISEVNDVITITASNCSKIEWISGGVVYQEGTSFNIKNYSGINYIRAKLTGVDGSFAFTQAFGITII